MKSVNTVRWSARERCLDILLQRYESLLETLKCIKDDVKYDSKHRADANGILIAIQKKEFLCTATMFREIFAVTGPLSRYLQSVDIDIIQALEMADMAAVQLNKLRESVELIVTAAHEINSEATWQDTRIPCRKPMPDEESGASISSIAEEKWKRATFYMTLDAVCVSLNDRFLRNKQNLRSMGYFAPQRFSEITEKVSTAAELEKFIKDFCELYRLDTKRCADELFSFMGVGILEQFHMKENKDEVEECPSYSESEEETPEDNSDPSKIITSPIGALKVLCNPSLRLVDAYPTLTQAYSIIVATPVSSCTAERSFSALKRVKTRLRSTMLQARLEGLLLISVERELANDIDTDRIINDFGKSSNELTRALLHLSTN
jgi:hypothetical protein